jgi:hypothetical protein
MTSGLSCDLARASAATTRKTAEGIPSDSSHAVSEPRRSLAITPEDTYVDS